MNGKNALKQVIVVRRDLRMRQGKACSQSAHASGEFMREALLAVVKGKPHGLSDKEMEWMWSGMAKITVRSDSLEDFESVRDQAIAAGLKVHVITDSGRTEFHNVPTITALAIGPDLAEKIDKITGDHNLL